MICPNCKAEYREGFTTCADCEVSLVWQLPESAAESPTESPGESPEDPFCQFWEGADPRIHAELCFILDEQHIPYRTIRRADNLFNLNVRSPLRIGIPASLFDKAEAAIKEFYGTADDSKSGWFPPSPELPDAQELLPEPDAKDWNPEDWCAENATAEVWSGSPVELADLVIAALRENRIHVRCQSEQIRETLYVLPEDEFRAREIVREVIDGTPPQ